MPSIRKAIVNYIAHSRRKVAELALAKIPMAELHDLGWRGSNIVIDKAAVPICKKLNQLGVEIPHSVRPGRYKTVYHMRYLDTSTADRLYEAGFHDLDVEDDEGWTPLLLSCSGLHHMESLDSSDPLPLWYLDHGVTPRPTAASQGTSHIHLLAHRFKHYLRYYHPSGAKYLRLSATISRFAFASSGIALTSTDQCHCPCSESGCLPSTIFLKQQGTARSLSQPLYWAAKYSHLRQAFSLDDPEHSPKLEQIRTIHSAAARLEMFERLGITHTCCASPTGGTTATADVEDTHAIWDEESELIAYLNDWMDLFYELERNYKSDAESDGEGGGDDGNDTFMFWDSWWTALEKFMPERPWVRYHVCGDGERGDSGKACWQQDDDHEFLGIVRNYGPDRVAVRGEVGFAFERIRRRQREWEVLSAVEWYVLL
ncbi:hypothetical protein BFW01_g3906 [Lasiodiplodia theobromae]|nr:hypothetical protein BFW01_g3906 [Lasiodiplodia theobromae]